MSNEQITLVGIGVTFLIGLLNFMYSIVNNKNTRFINTVTSSRVMWIDNLRKSISEYVSLIPLSEVDYIKLFEKKQEFIEKFNKLHMNIELMLNQKDKNDKIIIDNLININKYITEILNCVDLLEFKDLKDLEVFDVESMFDIKRRIINELNADTQDMFKEEIVSRCKMPELNVMKSKDLIAKVEYENWGIKRDAYCMCINKISKKINEEVDILIDNTKVLLKKEWDRVKIESQVGKFDLNKQDWDVIVGFSKLNKIFKIIFVIMLMLIVILTIFVITAFIKER
jgi:hypothetical protein